VTVFAPAEQAAIPLLVRRKFDGSQCAVYHHDDGALTSIRGAAIKSRSLGE